MPEHGITDKGFVIKRLDEIESDINDRLKKGWGVDITVEPQSLIGALITSFSDKLAELWELAQDEYYAMYPSTAEGENLDNAMQYAGVMRLKKARTMYSLKCTGDDGTTIPYGALVKSTTQPVKQMQCVKTQLISRGNFREITLYCLETTGTFTISLNGIACSVTVDNGDSKTILESLSEKINASNMIKSIEQETDTERWTMKLIDKFGNSDNEIVLSSNISVSSCSSNVTFETLEYGEITLPYSTVTEISTMIDGWTSCTNDKAPVSGRLDETDVEARQSYIRRIALRSENMLSSIASALYNDVQGVEYVACYENDSDETDSEGRPPHSIEVIVAGGSEGDVANKIWSKKPVGISTYGNVKTEINDEYKNTHAICFSRPFPLYIWFKVSISSLSGESVVNNYAEIIKQAVVENISCEIGENIIAQKLVAPIYNVISGIDYVEIKCFASESRLPSSHECTLDSIMVTARQVPDISEERIEVILVE